MRKRELILRAELAIVPLTRGIVAIIDAKFAPFVGRWNWCIVKGSNNEIGYARRTGWENKRQVAFYLHRVVWELEYGPFDHEVDHRSRDTLDCRLENLRSATRVGNMCNVGLRKDNQTGYKGVSPRRGSWCAYISIGKSKNKYLGSFKSPAEAARAYDRAALRIQGDFAVLNFSKEDYE